MNVEFFNKPDDVEVEISELRKLTEFVKVKFGFDFSEYAISSFRRRVSRIMQLSKFDSVEKIIKRLDTTPAYFEEFLCEITVNTTEYFRDPTFWKAMREKVLPELKSFDVIRIWHAGCSTGEEVYSMAIVLKELGLLHKVKVFATDVNPVVMQTAKNGRYRASNLALYKENFLKAGNEGAFEDYVTLEGNYLKMDTSLIEHVNFKEHDLVQGEAFSKFDIILCRNVMIYFNQTLQERVFKLFQESMFKKAFLGIGSKESLVWSNIAFKFRTIDEKEKIYRLKE
ncbi:MAG: CheR family methyltransferase [Luteibaculaceae bacterium]